MPPKPRILIVEDNRDVSEVLELFLSRRGFSLSFAYCGLTGLALAKGAPPDLVILNYMMPHMNGLDVLRELRSDPKTAGVKVIMTSGWPVIVERSAAAGAQDALVYPIAKKELCEKVDRVLAS